DDTRQSIQQDIKTDEVNGSCIIRQSHKGEPAEFLPSRREPHPIRQLDDLIGGKTKGVDGEVRVGPNVEHVCIYPAPYLAHPSGNSPRQLIGPAIEALTPRLLEFPRSVDMLPF